MTRTLWTLLSAVILSSMMSGCSLFGGDDKTTNASELDTASVSGSEMVLDAEDEMLAESQDLTESAGDDLQDLQQEAPSTDIETETSLDNEFQAAELGGSQDEFDENFTDESGFEDSGDEFAESFSATNDEQVDQNLANDELNDFSAEEFPGEEDQMAFEAEPVVDEPDPLEPVVDVPQQQVTMSGNQITNLEYKAFENGGTVVIETTQPAQYQKIVDPDLNQVVIEVKNVFLPERFKRPYITKDFKQDIATINAYADAGAARFVIQLKRPIEPQVQVEGNSILVMTAGGASMQAASDSPITDGPAEQPLDQLVAENQMKVQAKAAPSRGNVLTNVGPDGRPIQNPLSAKGSTFGGADKSGLTLGSTQYSGEKINLEFIDEDVRTIIEVIAERSGVNLVMDEDVSGKANIRLRQVPWDQALLVLLRSKGLGYVRQGSVLRIAKQSTLSKEAEAVSMQIKSEKQAKLLSGGIKVKYIPVSYAKVSELATKLKPFTSTDGKIAFDDRTSSLVITDYGEYIERIIDLVKALDTAPMQVEIEAKLVEARETFVRDVGINWDLSGQSFPFGSQTGQINSSLSGSLPTNGLSMDLNVGTFDIFGDLTAALAVYESDNKVKVLSQPRIVTMNKVEANITQTLQLPIRQTTFSNSGVSNVTFRFIDLKLSLKVTPQITFKGDVILEVQLDRDFPGVQNENGAREINKRHAQSTVMVKNGKTAVIGGIYQLDDTDNENGIPLLKDLPLIGYLFKQTHKEKLKNELLLFLKPKILREIDGPMVSKAKMNDTNYDPFEELSVDEGSTPGQNLIPPNPSPEEKEDFEEEFAEEFDNQSI